MGGDGRPQDGGGEVVSPWVRPTLVSWWLWLSLARIVGFLPINKIEGRGDLPDVSRAWTRYGMGLLATLTLLRATSTAFFWLGPYPTQCMSHTDVFHTAFIAMVMLKILGMSVVSLACLRARHSQCAVVAGLQRCLELQPLLRPECWARLLAINATFFALLIFFPFSNLTGAQSIELTFDVFSDVCDVLSTLLLAVLEGVFANEVSLLWAFCTDLRLRILSLLLTSPTSPAFPPASPSTSPLASSPASPFLLRTTPGDVSPLQLSPWSMENGRHPDLTSSPGGQSVDSAWSSDTYCRPAARSPPAEVAVSWREVRLRHIRLQDVRLAMCSANGWPNLIATTLSLLDTSVSLFQDVSSVEAQDRGSMPFFSAAWGLVVAAKFAFICCTCQQVQNEHSAMLHALNGFLARYPDLPSDVNSEVRGCISQIQLLKNDFTALDIVTLNVKTMASTILAVFSYIVVLVQFDRSC
ncbi:uncharacterized protein LOC127750654 [Frankliniella occidentalis]|uniref:Gustatory receptor n=1 Tax=Frankliniella occidentalis TaxID=133901 RepID=A0A9C6XS08_FRAOC|nr:uncharacterized protein LOC127750654 [Frankliniella occidentalis]